MNQNLRNIITFFFLLVLGVSIFGVPKDIDPTNQLEKRYQCLHLKKCDR